MSLHPPREASRATGEGIIVSKYPDVCRSPTAPVPYTIVAYQNDDANTASSVFLTGQRAHKQNSIVTKCMGDEPGVGLGVKSGTMSSICHRKGHSKTVRIEGHWATRDTDEWWMNNRNTIGKLVWPKHSKIFSPTPPIAEYSAMAKSDEGRVMSDAQPEGWIMNAQYAQNTAAAPLMQQAQANPAPQQSPPRQSPPVTPNNPQPGRVATPNQPAANDNVRPSAPSRWWKWIKSAVGLGARVPPPAAGAAAGGLAYGGLAAGVGAVGISRQRAILDDMARAQMGLGPRLRTPFMRLPIDIQPLGRLPPPVRPPEAKAPEEEQHAPPTPNARTEANLSIEERRRRRRRNCRLRKYSEGCADAMPYSTPHHVVPDRVFREPGSTKLYNPGLSHGDGYTICVDGGTPRFSGPNANEHGLIHAIYDARERAMGQAGIPRGTAPLQQLEVAGVQAASQVTGCSAVVMLRQLQHYHRSQGLRGDMRFRATKSAPWPSPSQIGNGSGTNGL